MERLEQETKVVIYFSFPSLLAWKLATFLAIPLFYSFELVCFFFKKPADAASSHHLIKAALWKGRLVITSHYSLRQRLYFITSQES